MPKTLANAQQGAGRAEQSRWGPFCSLLTPSPQHLRLSPHLIRLCRRWIIQQGLYQL